MMTNFHGSLQSVQLKKKEEEEDESLKATMLA